MKQLLNAKFDLYEFLTIKIMKMFERHLEFTDIEKDKVYYGVMSLLINIIKTTFIFLVAILLGVIKEILVMTILVGMLRLTAAGLHAKSNFMCTLTTLASYIGGAFLSLFFPVKFEIAFIVSVGLTFIICRYAPADTENRPIVGKEKRRKLKIQTLITAVSYLIINLLVRNIVFMNLRFQNHY